MKPLRFLRKGIHLMAAFMVAVLLTNPAISAQAAERTGGMEVGTYHIMTLNSPTGVDDVDTALDNFGSFLRGIVKVVGGAITLYGLVQIGMSLPQHDPSQRMMGFLFLAGGIIILFAPEILDFIQG